MSDTKKNWLDKTGVIHLWKTIKALLDTKVDKIEGLGLSSNDYTVEDKTKVSKIKPVQNTLTSTDTEAGLSAAQGKVLKDIIDTKADNIDVQPITIPTTGWGTENGVSAYPNYIDIPLTGVTSKDAVVIDVSPSSAYFAAQAQFTNTESMDGAVRLRAKNVPTSAIKGQWYVIHGGGAVYEGEIHNYYDKTEIDKMMAGKLDIKPTSSMGLGSGLEIDSSGKLGTSFYNRGHITDANNASENGWYSILSDAANIPAADSGQIVNLKSDGYIWPSQLFLPTSQIGLYYRTFDGTNWYGWQSVGVVASGSNYVRFSDGTQVCWGDTAAYSGFDPMTTAWMQVTFAQPFIDANYGITADPVFDGGNTWLLHTFMIYRQPTYANIGLVNGGSNITVNAGTIYSYVAIGRWK